MLSAFFRHRLAVVVGLLLLLSYGYLALHSRSYAQAQLFDLWLVVGIASTLIAGLWYYYHATDRQFPVPVLLFFTLAFNVLGVFSFPVLEDDFYRYLWDGRMWLEAGSPYGISPLDYADITQLNDSFEHVLDGINYPDVSTIYGPVCQWVFAAGYLLAPAEVWPLQAVFALSACILVLLLLRVTSANNVLLLAWSPLLLKEFAFTAHPDVLGAMFIVAALLAVRSGRMYSAAVLLALAVGVKVFAIVCVPFLLAWRWRVCAVFLLTLILLALPFGLIQAWVPDGLTQMAEHWVFNAPIYSAFLWLGAPLWAIKWVLLSLFVVGYAYCLWVWRTRRLYTLDPVEHFRGDWLYGALFLVIPAFNPWYLVFLLPFAVIHLSRWAWVAATAVLLAYGSGINLANTDLGLYDQPPELLILEFAVIAVALALDMYQHRKRKI